MSEFLLFKEMAADGDLEAAELLASMPEEPPISPHSLFYWRAYQELGRDRPGGDGFLQIPYTSIITYADEYGLEGDDREEFKMIIMAVDLFEVNQTNEKRRQEQSKAQSRRP